MYNINIALDGMVITFATHKRQEYCYLKQININVCAVQYRSGVPLSAKAGRDAVDWKQFEENSLRYSEQICREL